MCTRYITPEQRVIEAYISHVPPWWQQSFDVRITNRVPVIRGRADGTHDLESMHWTLMPPRFESKKAWRFPTFNLRGERIEESRLYAPAFAARRCLLPAAGFYEWPEIDGTKVRHCVRPAEGELFFFAGLWNRWQSKDGVESDSTCGLITCEANAFMRPIHNTGKNRYRMPVILDWVLGNTWLFGDRDEARELIGPCPDEWLQAYPVARNLGDTPAQMAPEGAIAAHSASLS